MIKFRLLNALAIAGLVLLSLLQLAWAEFKIDYEGNTFLLDGKPFRYVSGSVHYFRIPKEYWRDRLRKARAAGLNVISTYVEWSSHERIPGVYDFNGNLNITEFITIAQEEDLHVIMRPGPYINSERDMGGLPYWLLQFHPDIYLRTSDPNYKKYAERWLDVLFKEIDPLWNGNGGPIIMAQVENELGSYVTCDKDYYTWLRDLLKKYIGEKAVLFSTDAPGDNLNCGKIEGVHATVDFGPTTPQDIKARFDILRQYEPKGPLVNSEFYPGAVVTHWGDQNMAHTDTNIITVALREMLDEGASVNYLMFHGGSNFGFTAGANMDASYRGIVQSYDFDAPVSEAGDLTERYYEIRKVIADYLPIPNISVSTSPKGDYGELTLKATASLLASQIRSGLGRTIQKDYPTTFEAVGQNFGYLLYETTLPESSQQELKIESFNDMAHVYVNENLVGVLSREDKTTSLTLGDTNQGDKLSIVVENLGRICVGGMINDSKGILSNVTLGGQILQSWDQTSFELDNVKAVEECFSKIKNKATKAEDCNNGNGFIFYVSTFQVDSTLDKENKAVVLDSYLDMSNLKKGLVFINGFNIGRYWSAKGPQYSLYIPGVYLKSSPEENIIVVMEEETKEDEIILSFTTDPIFTRK